MKKCQCVADLGYIFLSEKIKERSPKRILKTLKDFLDTLLYNLCLVKISCFNFESSIVGKTRFHLYVNREK